MRYQGQYFKYKTFNSSKLVKEGFKKEKGAFIKTFKLSDEFDFIVSIALDEVDLRVVEVETNSDYDLFFVKSASGKFIGALREKAEDILAEIEAGCCDMKVFKSDYAYKIINYIKEKYDIEAEYLWEKFPNNAIFRKKDKWFGAILSTKREKFYKNQKGEIEVINLKETPENVLKIVDNETIFEAYHMNKKHWYSIPLEKGIEIEKIYKKIDDSYNLV